MPRYDAQHKAETRRRIIDTASARFKQDGIDASGIATLMADAGLTNGAFYAHFPSKSDLVANVMADQLRAQHEVLSGLPSGRAAIDAYVREYLSPYHRDHPESGCPNAALLDEVSRCDDAVRQSYTDGVQAVVNTIAALLSPHDPTAARTTALGLFTLLVATLQLARAVSDPALSDEVLASGISNANKLLET
ncbi:TetR family transcriptional regulator [Mycobacterium sp. 852013-50091_SCH5140682]|uniref:TetR/AcrR family transcriptional regulator n=1 Tax=Mycobacterium sp. 852013-50091_SCH5140682 TaxID=1834109 RepID=UPI0007E9B107|nr:TetR/AcrR family transcriptional regulator [Mycobacterium sp. 852013-50091_SCH5140682]OBC12627.1 TetR family transcriptional regulator [Mycobacterium sp. 852013-50091_SCH5140682]